MTKILKKTKEKDFYICPHCKRKQTTINEWQNYWICYERELETQDYCQREMEEGGKDTEFCCPECGEEIDYNLIKKYYE